MKKKLLFPLLVLLVTNAGYAQTSIFSEDVGSGTGTIPVYSGWQTGLLTHTGSGSVSTSSSSSGYVGSSGASNVLLTNITGQNFQIAGINSSTASSLVLSFGLYKSTASAPGTGTGSDLSLEVSSNGFTYAQLSFAALPTGSGTDTWYKIVASGNIPSASNLRIRWTNNSTVTEYRIDDIQLTNAVNYFDKVGSLDLSQLSSWTTDVNGGSGTSPSNFTNNFQIFNQINTATPVISSDWAISGIGSSLIVGNGAFVPTLTLANGKTLSIGSGAGFTISNGTLQLNPSSVFTVASGATVDFKSRQVILKSDATGTASIGIISGSLSGATSVVVERYIPSFNRKSYVLVSSPVNSPTIKSAWQENGNTISGYGTQITGATIGNGFDGASASGLASVSYYNDLLGSGSKWVGLTNTTTNYLSAGTGYLLYVRGDRSENRPVTGNSSNTTLRATGSIVTGSVAFSTATSPGLTNGNGKFSLIANPYPCAIDWTSASITKTNISNTFYVYDPNLGVYVTSDGTTKSPNTSKQQAKYIQSGQAFFVLNTASSPSLTITEASKVTVSSATNVTVFGEQTVKPQLNINVYHNSATDNSFADGVVALFDNSFKATVATEDAAKMENINETFSLRRNNKELSIEGRPLVTGKDTLFFTMANFSKADYSLNIDAVNFAGANAVLEDKFTSTKQPLDAAGITTYKFNVNGDAASSANDRFIITFGNVATNVSPDAATANSLFVKASPNPVKNQLNVSFKTATVENTVISIVNSLGQVVKTLNAGKTNTGSMAVNVSSLAAGNYTVQLISGDKKVAVQKLVKE